MNTESKIKLYTFTLDCKEPCELANFYAALLKWEVVYSDENYACVGAPGTNQGAYPGLTFQRNPEYIPPVWPQEREAQQQMAHIDFAVNDLETSVQHALQCGAVMAGEQFSEQWKVMLDPSGHPFCLCHLQAMMESDQFGLL